MCACCCYWRMASGTSALDGVVQLKRLCLAAYPISAARKRRSRLNRIGHPDWVKLCVELNCAPNQNTFCYRLVKAIISELTLSSMSAQLWKIMHKQSFDVSSPNTSPIMVKKEVDFIAYVENNLTDPSEVYYGCSSDQRDSRFNGWRGKINCGGRQRNNNNKTCSTDKKPKIDPLGHEGNTTVCFKRGCKFHWSYDCPYIDDTKDLKNGSYLSLCNIIMMSQLTKQQHLFGWDTWFWCSG